MSYLSSSKPFHHQNQTIHSIMLKRISAIKGLWGREERKDKELEGLDAKELQIFSYETLLAATSTTLQRGSFGSIFKGKLKDGRKIRVENLSVNSAQGRVEFMELANLLSGLHHNNVVKLLGYCTEYDQSFLVYEYGGKKSLDKLLFSENWKGKLNWRERYEIMIGIAKGLSYLHGGSGKSIIIHPDISPSNILIDHTRKPKISGFCLGCPLLNDEILDTTYLFGTWGHMAPEYIKKGHVSTKSNIYSFGVLVLELITGKDNSRPLSNALRRWQLVSPQTLDLVDWAHQLYEENKSLEMMDSNLVDCAVNEQVAKCIKIGLLCTQDDPLQRPNMDHVVSMLIENQVPMEIQIIRPRFLNENELKPSHHSDGDEYEEVVNVGVATLNYMPMDEHQIQDDRDEILKKKIAAYNCQNFSYETLYDATNKFASQNVLGQGGFGLVYKGKLDDGREIAVKKSSKVLEERMNTLGREVELLSRVKHPNVVKLLGYCAQDDKFLLVYEYVPNNSLDKFLFGSNGREQELDWARTYRIIVGVAKGLSYLHTDPQNCIIHRDIKAENILLHQNWVPKIADFGISRLFPVDQTHVYTGAVGTWGHIAPEYLDHGHVSVKTDVYSFGVLLLQLVSGKRYSFRPPQEDNAIGLLDWVYKLFKAGKISDIMDPALADSAIIEQVENCIEIGLRCTQGDPKSRPDMECVMFMLTANQSHRKMSICRPGIYGYRGYLSDSFSDITQNQCNESKEVQIRSSWNSNSSTFSS